MVFIICSHASWQKSLNQDGRLVYYECGERIRNGDEPRDTDDYWLEQGYATVTALGFDCAIPLARAEERKITERLKGVLS